MHPTRARVLLTLALVAAVLAGALGHRAGASPRLGSWLSLAWIVIVVGAEGRLAQVTRARLAGRPRTKPIVPLEVARLAALAKASAMVGAVAAGGYAGLVAAVVTGRSGAAHRELAVCATGVALALALIAVALWLEHACRVRS